MRVKVLEAGRAYYNYGIIDFAEGEEVSGGLALHLLESGSNVEPADEAAEEWLTDRDAPEASDEEDPEIGDEADAELPAGLDIDGTAADVLAWVGDDPDRATEAFEGELAKDKPRSTLVKALEKLAAQDED
jgi:hypothetical protein